MTQKEWKQLKHDVFHMKDYAEGKQLCEITVNGVKYLLYTKNRIEAEKKLKELIEK